MTLNRRHFLGALAGGAALSTLGIPAANASQQPTQPLGPEDILADIESLTAAEDASEQLSPQTGLALPRRNTRAHYVVDYETGTVLSEHNANVPIHPASITKLFLAAAYYDLKSRNVITPTDRMEADLRNSLITSNNRAAARLAEDISLTPVMRDRAQAIGRAAGTQYAFSETMMDPYFQSLALDNTQIWNTSGLPGPTYTETPYNVSTARDIVRLSKHVIFHHPEILDITSARYYDERLRAGPNTNRLLPNSPRRNAIPTDGVDGLKTGFINASKYNLAFTAKRGEDRLVGVVIGSPSSPARYREARQLVEDGFANLEQARQQALQESRLRLARRYNGAIPIIEYR